MIVPGQLYIIDSMEKWKGGARRVELMSVEVLVADRITKFQNLLSLSPFNDCALRAPYSDFNLKQRQN